MPLILVSRRRHLELSWSGSEWWVVDERLSERLTDDDVRRQFGREPFARRDGVASSPGPSPYAALVSRSIVQCAVDDGWQVTADDDVTFSASSEGRTVRASALSSGHLTVEYLAGADSWIAGGFDVFAVETLVEAVLRGRAITAADTAAFFVDRLASVEVHEPTS